jgi:hypothetical protein
MKNDLQNGTKHLQNGPKLLAADEITVSSVRGWGRPMFPSFGNRVFFFNQGDFKCHFNEMGVCIDNVVRVREMV